MTVSTISDRVSYAGNGVTTVFSYPYLFHNDTDIQVVVVTDTTGATVTKTLTTDYTVSGAGTGSGSVTMLTAPITGETVTLIPNYPYTQSLDLVDNDPLPAEELESQLDKLMLVNQQLKSLIGRGFTLNDADATGISLVLPVMLASKLLQVKSDLSGFELVSPADLSLSTVSTFITTLLDDVDAAAFMTTLGITSFAQTLLDDVDAATFMTTLGITSFAQTLLDDVDAATARATLGVIEHGQCRLDYVSTTQIKLSPYNGNKIVINGSIFEIPSAGVTLANTGLTASTLYYIYLYDNAGTITLQAHTNGHVTDATAGNVGVEVRSDTSAKTLVGMVYMDAGSPGTFKDYWTLSYFNRKTKVTQGALTAGTTSTTSTTGAEINSTETRSSFITWGDEAVRSFVQGYMWNSAGNFYSTHWIGVDGIAATEGGTVYGGSGGNAGCELSSVLSEGFHYETLVGATQSGGTTVFRGAASVSTIATGMRISITTEVQG